MDDNVFAPGGDHSSNSGGVRGSAEPFQWTDRSVNDAIALLGRAWELVIGNLGTIGIGILIMFGLSVVSQVVNFALSLGVETISDPFTKIGVQMTAQYGAALVFMAIQIYFQLGLIKLVLELDRGNEVELDMLWTQGSAWIQVIAVSIVLTFAYSLVFGLMGGLLGGVGYGIMLATDPQTGFAAIIGLITLGIVLMIPVLVVIGLGLSMFMHSIVDERTSFISSLPFSWNLTDGWKVFLFIQALLIFVLSIAVAVITCCMGLSIVQGVVLCMQAVTYNAVINDADATERFLG